jgi:hypothetical protein
MQLAAASAASFFHLAEPSQRGVWRSLTLGFAREGERRVENNGRKESPIKLCPARA